MSGYVEKWEYDVPVDGAIAEYRRESDRAEYSRTRQTTEKHIGVAKFETFAGDTDLHGYHTRTLGLKLWSPPELSLNGRRFTERPTARIDDVANENHIGIALQSASGNGRLSKFSNSPVSTDSIRRRYRRNLLLTNTSSAIGRHPARCRAGQYSWTKVETNGLGDLARRRERRS